MTRLRHLALAVVFATAFAGTACGEVVTFRVAGWNMESGESSDQHLKQQLAAKEQIDLWGFSEVRNNSAATAYAEGAESGEGSDYELILGTTGGSDRLAIVYNTARLELVGSEEIGDTLFSNHRKPLVAHFRGILTGLEFKFMVNHLARGDSAARLDQAEFLNQWVGSEPLPVIAVGDYNFDYHVEFGHAGERDPGFDAMIAQNAWIWLQPETLVKTQADDRFMSVLDFVFIAHPPAGVTGESIILERDGNSPAVEIDFSDSDDDTDHRPVIASFTIGADAPPVDRLDAEPEAPGAEFDREAILARIAELQRELQELKRLVQNNP